MQTLPAGQWELLLVDNASDETLEKSWDLSWHPRARHLREDKPGKTHALLTAIGEAQGELLMTVDDDNVLERDYLEATLRIGRDHPWLAVWGGNCLAEFEAAPPKFLEKYLGFIAVSAVTRPRWGNSSVDFECIPPGAGMTFRRVIAEAFRRNLEHPQYREFLPGGQVKRRGFGFHDTMIALTAIDLGFGAGRFPELKLVHLIPKHRVDPQYMLGLIKGDAAMTVILNHLRNQMPTARNQESGWFRALWLRLRLSHFDYQAWKASQAGVKDGMLMLGHSHH